MPVAGNKKKPLKLKLLEGNPRHENLDYEEPIPESGEPDTPSHLSSYAETIWDNTCDHLRGMNILAKCDEVVIETFARITARWQALERDIDNEGQFMVVPIRIGKSPDLLYDDKGNVLTTITANPRLSESRLLLQQVRMLAAELGLSPTARARLSMPSSGKNKKQDDMESMLGAM